MTEDELKKMIADFRNVREDERSTGDWMIYSIDDQIMAAISKGKVPVRVELRCDRNLAKELKSEYESVVNPVNLSKNNFVQILLVGQLTNSEVKDLVRHAYEMTRGIIE